MNSVSKTNFEWLNIDDKELSYHLDQYENPKEYTKAIYNILEDEKLVSDNQVILDFGCGCGGVTNFIAQKYSKANFIGLDLNSKYIEVANKFSIDNTNYFQFDLYSDKPVEEYSEYFHIAKGLISIQTLSWLPDYNRFIEFFSKFNLDWILVTSLFYEGYVDAEIKIKDFTRQMGENVNFRESYYNIYSIEVLNKNLIKYGYRIYKYIPFVMPFDIKKPDIGAMSTYTVKLFDESRLQISGPILMSWYTLIIKKI